MKTTNKVSNDWDNYDQVIGQCQLSNYGIIFLDEYGLPIDNEYDVEDLYQTYMEDQ